MDLDSNEPTSESGSVEECIILPSSPMEPVLSADTETPTPKRSTSKVRLSKADSVRERER